MMKIFSSDFAFKVINEFNEIIKLSIQFCDSRFGIIGKTFLSPLISISAQLIHLIAFFIGVFMVVSMWIGKLSIRKIRSLLRYLARSILFWALLYIMAIFFLIIKNPLLYIGIITVSFISFCLIIQFSSTSNNPRRR